MVAKRFGPKVGFSVKRRAGHLTYSGAVGGTSGKSEAGQRVTVRLVDGKVLLASVIDRNSTFVESVPISRGRVNKVVRLERAAASVGQALYSRGIRTVLVDVLGAVPKTGVAAVVDGLKVHDMQVTLLEASRRGPVGKSSAATRRRRELGFERDRFAKKKPPRPRPRKSQKSDPIIVDPVEKTSFNLSTFSLPNPSDEDRAASAPARPLAEARPLELELGPFYSLSGLMEEWRISREEVDALVESHTLLGLPTTDDQTIYPSFQFAKGSGNLEVLTDLPKVLGVLAQGRAGPTLIASWLVTERPDLAYRTAIEVMRDGERVEDVLQLANGDAARWAR